MTRLLIATSLTTLLAAGSAAAYQGAPPAGQTRPPVQTPPQTTPPPLLPTGPAATPKAPAIQFPAEARIGFVNLQSVVSDSKLGKAGSASMTKFTTDANADLTALQKTVDSLQKEIQQGAGLLKPADLQMKQSLLDQKNRDLQHESENVQARVTDFNRQLLESFSDKVVPIVEEIRAEKGLWVVFAVQDESGGLAVLAANPGLDLSAEVVKRLDVKYPGK